jgi:hypothetical protein
MLNPNTNGVQSVMNGTSQQNSINIAPDVNSGFGGPQPRNAGVAGAIGSAIAGQVVGGLMDKFLGDKPMSGSEAGMEHRDYMNAAFPHLNQWEQAGVSGSQGGAVAQMENQKEMQDKQLATQYAIAQLQSNTQTEIAGVQSVTSRANTKDQVFAQNTKLIPEVGKLNSEKLLLDFKAEREEMIREGIFLDNETKKVNIEKSRFANSPEGKLALDLYNAGSDKWRAAALAAGMSRELISDLMKFFPKFRQPVGRVNPYEAPRKHKYSSKSSDSDYWDDFVYK